MDKVDDHDLQRIQRMKFEEQKRELEKVKQRRLEREREREERRAMMELEERQRENDKFSKFRQDEDEFHLQQARLRSNIRIVDGRAKPIDLLGMVWHKMSLKTIFGHKHTIKSKISLKNLIFFMKKFQWH